MTISLNKYELTNLNWKKTISSKNQLYSLNKRSIFTFCFNCEIHYILKEKLTKISICLWKFNTLSINLQTVSIAYKSYNCAMHFNSFGICISTRLNDFPSFRVGSNFSIFMLYYILIVIDSLREWFEELLCANNKILMSKHIFFSRLKKINPINIFSLTWVEKIL